MGTIYVARSATLSKWGSDVGLGKHLYKVGCTDAAVKPLVAAGWAGASDWQLVRSEPADDLVEAEILARLAAKDKVVDPNYYPRIRGTPGIFKVDPLHVERHILVTRALEGDAAREAIKLKPVDFAVYLIHNARR